MWLYPGYITMWLYPGYITMWLYPGYITMWLYRESTLVHHILTYYTYRLALPFVVPRVALFALAPIAALHVSAHLSHTRTAQLSPLGCRSAFVHV